MNILITGGKGFIATELYKTFDPIYNVTSVSRSDFDLRDSFQTMKFFSDKFFDVVIHCASTGGSRLKNDSEDVMDNNLEMYYNLLSNKHRFKKLIHFGSGAEYYMKDTPYGISKRVIAESILHNKNFYNIRLFAVFGENELDTRFIKSSIKRYINKKDIIIYENKLMDFFYIKDLIKVVEYYLLNNDDVLPKEIDCCYDNVYSLKNIANIINNLDNYRVNVITENHEKVGYNSNKPLELPDLIKNNFIGLIQGIKNVHNKLKK